MTHLLAGIALTALIAIPYLIALYLGERRRNRNP